MMHIRPMSHLIIGYRTSQYMSHNSGDSWRTRDSSMLAFHKMYVAPIVLATSFHFCMDVLNSCGISDSSTEKEAVYLVHVLHIIHCIWYNWPIMYI